MTPKEPIISVSLCLYANDEHPDCPTVKALEERTGRKWVPIVVGEPRNDP